MAVAAATATVVPLLASPFGERNASAASPSAIGESSFHVDLATSSPPEVTNRIPAMAVTESGDVVAAYDKRNDGAGDLPGDIDIVIRRSTDNGSTWSDPEVVVDRPAPEGCGDPSLLTDQRTGRLFLFCTYSAGKVGFGNSQPGTNNTTDPNTLHLRVRHSDDGGRTWSEPDRLNPQVKKKSWRAVFLSSGHGISTSRGRLIQPVVVKDNAGRIHSANIYSDDHGRSWQRGELIDTGNESKAVELSDGTIRQNMRPNSGDHRLLAESTDGGISFASSRASDELIDPIVNGDVIRVNDASTGPRRNWLVFSNPASRTARTDLTVRLSRENGNTWPVETRLHDGPSGYSTMVMMPNGRVGVLAEVGTDNFTERIRFYSLALSGEGTAEGPR